jgi:SAM-dependent methyltransferase
VGANPLPKSSPRRKSTSRDSLRRAGEEDRLGWSRFQCSFRLRSSDDESWRAIYLANWESRVPVHTGPGGYDRTSFDDPAHLSTVVRYDLPRLDRLDGLDMLHLQCHVGTDTISLARLGARTTVGLDFSPAALREARNLAARTGTAVTYIEGDAHPGEYVLATQRDRRPLTYTLQAAKEPTAREPRHPS